MDHDTDVPVGATDRRTALKKAAAAAGVVAWTTPVVQVLSSGTAHAQTVTGCSPMISVLLQQTGKECGCAGTFEKCCNEATYFPTATASCGATCATVSAGLVTLSPDPSGTKFERCPPVPAINFPGTFEINCPPTVFTLSVQVKCADGVTTKVTATPADITCKFCVEVTPQFAPQSDVSTSNEVTATTTTEPSSPANEPAQPVTTEQAPPVPTEPAAAPTDRSTP